MARYLEALVNGGGNIHGRVLQPETLALMLSPHYRSDPRLHGMGLAFFLDEIGSHAVAGHSGGWTGFAAWMLFASHVGAGVIVVTNGGVGGFPLAGVRLVAEGILGEVLETSARHRRVPQRPDIGRRCEGITARSPAC